MTADTGIPVDPATYIHRYLTHTTNSSRMLLLARLPHGSTVTTHHDDTRAHITITTPDGATETHTCTDRADCISYLMAHLARREDLVVCGTVRVSSTHGTEEGRLFRRRRHQCGRAYRRRNMRLGASGVWQCAGCRSAQRSAEEKARKARNARRRAARTTT